MLKPEIIELIALMVFGPVLGAYLCLRTNVGDWVAEVVSRPFGFLDELAGAQPEPAYVKAPDRLETAA